MIIKEDFTIAYASTVTKPSAREIEYVKEHLEEICSNACNRALKHSGVIECPCVGPHESEDDNNYDLLVWDVEIPIEIAVEPDEYEGDERLLSILQCSNCGKWALCD